MILVKHLTLIPSLSFENTPPRLIDQFLTVGQLRGDYCITCLRSVVSSDTKSVKLPMTSRKQLTSISIRINPSPTVPESFLTHVERYSNAITYRVIEAACVLVAET